MYVLKAKLKGHTHIHQFIDLAAVYRLNYKGLKSRLQLFIKTERHLPHEFTQCYCHSTQLNKPHI